jgi:hypothetical protein
VGVQGLTSILVLSCGCDAKAGELFLPRVGMMAAGCAWSKRSLFI